MLPTSGLLESSLSCTQGQGGAHLGKREEDWPHGCGGYRDAEAREQGLITACTWERTRLCCKLWLPQQTGPSPLPSWEAETLEASVSTSALGENSDLPG